MEINTCEQYVLANLGQTLKQLDEASAEIESLKKQLYDARDSPLAAELRNRGLSSLFSSGTRYNMEVFRDGVLLDFDVWTDVVVDLYSIDGLITKDEFIEEFNQELHDIYDEELAEYEEEHGIDHS
ncbi:hypothetical protein [Collinsella aerofaciens]|uniref:hypothetical protein n=1 Tax=Collinsella aerofaciens TaxID=74426 RepID=UPI003D79C08A